MIHSLFPVPLYKELLENIDKNSLKFLTTLPGYNNLGNTTSLDTNILDREPLKDLKKNIETHLRFFFSSVYVPKNNIDINITQSWINVTDVNGYHHRHKHQNSFLSGIFYIDVCENTDKIYFYSPKPECLTIESADFNEYNSHRWWFPIRKNELIIFPSYLEHSVDSVAYSSNRNQRVSLSFNSFLKGELGSILDLTQLRI